MRACIVAYFVRLVIVIVGIKVAGSMVPCDLVHAVYPIHVAHMSFRTI